MPAHWIKGNETSRQPNRWVWLGVASKRVPHPQGEAKVWDGAVTCMDSRDSNSKPWREPTWRHYNHPEGLWLNIINHARNDARTIVMAWDMGEVVRLTQCLELLPLADWTLDRWQVGDRFTLLKWRQGKRSLTLVDASGCLPMGKTKVTQAAWGQNVVMVIDPPAPGIPPSPARLEVSELRHAMMDLLTWQSEADLGNWSPTSGSQAWANWRHCHYTDTVLVHDEPEARTAEREAAWTGRCEAWRHGPLLDETWQEWDLPLAYPSVCLTANLPVVLRGRVRVPPPTVLWIHADNERWLIRAKIKTEAPVLPARHDGGMLWPVGEFEGWYWDDELAEATLWGAEVELLDSYRYSAAPALAEWAHYIVRFVNGEEPDSTPLRRAVVKGWGRSLIGRFGTRYWSWEDWGPTEVGGVRLDRLADRDTGAEGRWLHVGGRSMVALGMVDGSETAPALMSAVMSACRVRLWRIIQTAGPENVAYCDTDSVLVNPEGDRRLAVADLGSEIWGLRRKDVWRNLEVRGPRQVVSLGERRLSGVPANAQHQGDGSYGGMVTEGLQTAAQAGNLAAVIVRPKVWNMTGTDRRRLHLDGGMTGPVRV